MATATMERPTAMVDRVLNEYLTLVAAKAEHTDLHGLDNSGEQKLRKHAALLERDWRRDVEMARALYVFKNEVSSTVPDEDPSPAEIKRLKKAHDDARRERALAEVEHAVYAPTEKLRTQAMIRWSLLNGDGVTERNRLVADKALQVRKAAGVARNMADAAELSLRRATAIPAMRKAVKENPEIARAVGLL